MSADDFTKAVNARDEYAESLSRNTKRSDINKLIRDYCAKNDIVAPSPYFSDKTCVEYLFSVVDLEREHRASVGKQMVEDYKKDLLRCIINTLHDNGDTETHNEHILKDLYRDVFHKQPDGLSNEDIATMILNKVLEMKERLDHKEKIIGEIRVKHHEDCIKMLAESRAKIENYKLSLKNYILTDIQKSIYCYHGLETKSVEELITWLIEMAGLPKLSDFESFLDHGCMGT